MIARLTLVSIVIGWLSLTTVQAKPVTVVSLNPCFDTWLPQWLPNDWEIIPTTAHGNRLEQVLLAQPDYVVYGTFTHARLVNQLARHTQMVLVEQPQTWAQWQRTVAEAATTMAIAERGQAWLEQQQDQLSQLPNMQQSVLVLMPNQYAWGGASWLAQLFAKQQIRWISLHQDLVLYQLNLEQLLKLNPELIVLEGFAKPYARANDWLWHSALTPWLQQRQVRSIPTAVSGCPATRAVDYLQAVVGEP